MRGFPLSLFGLLVAIVIGAQRLPGQAQQLTIRVRVSDSAGAPVSGANLSLLRATGTLATAVSDADGRHTFTVNSGDADYEVVARKIGFNRASRLFRPASGDTVAVQLVLVRAAQTLDPVKVTADEALRRKSYHADAEDIANSPRPINDGMDVLLKLRPDMLWGRIGPRDATSYDPCWIRDVWVNGVRIVDPPISEMAIARKPEAPPPLPPVRRGPSAPSAAAQPHQAPADPLTHVPLTVWSVLMSIKPEHIEEVNYVDCFDFSMPDPHARNAVFVILKPGVRFTPGIGSYVEPTRMAAAPDTTHALPRYRMRVLGVFDETTGDPISGVEVIDTASGTKALTTATGTVTLAFLPDGGSTVRLHKAGYRDVTVDVVLAPNQVSPVTMTMRLE